jgi:hypothetical protein
MTIARRSLCIAAYAALFATAGVRAQNLVLNPEFEDRLTYWQYDPPDQVSWTNTVDYRTPDSGVPGSMVMDSSRGPVIALQCVPIVDFVDYVASMHALSHCPGQTLNVFFTDASCVAGASFLSAASAQADLWDRVAFFAHPTGGSQRAIVVVENASRCTDLAYIDDVVLQPNAIFANGFEPPTPP